MARQSEETTNLAAAARAGDTEAFRQLYETYRESLANWLQWKLSDHHEAEDVAQKAFIIAFRHIAALRDPSSFGSWLFSIARNTLINYCNRDRRHRNNFDLPEGLAAETPSPIQILCRREEFDQIMGAAQQLQDIYREPFLLRYRDHLTIEQTAIRLKRPVGTIKRQLHKARKTIAEDITEGTFAHN